MDSLNYESCPRCGALEACFGFEGYYIIAELPDKKLTFLFSKEPQIVKTSDKVKPEKDIPFPGYVECESAFCLRCGFVSRFISEKDLKIFRKISLFIENYNYILDEEKEDT